MTLIVALLASLTMRRAVLVTLSAAAVFAGLGVEEIERRDLRDRFVAAERDGALLTRVVGDSSFDEGDCVRTGRLGAATWTYLSVDARSSHVAYASGAVDPLFSVPVGWAALSGELFEGRLSAASGRFGRLDVIAADDVRLPELRAAALFRSEHVPAGGTCVVSMSWERQRSAREYVVSVLPAGQLEVTAVRPTSLMDERDRFNAAFVMRGPLVFSVFAGMICGFATVSRRRYVALLLSVGESRWRAVSAVAVPPAVDLCAGSALGVCAFVSWFAAGADQLEVGVPTASAVFTTSAATYLTVVLVGLVVVGGYVRYLRTDD